MDLNESLKALIAQGQQFAGKAGLGLDRAASTIGQDAAAGAGILNDPRNSWIGMNPVGRAASTGLGLLGMLKPFYHGTSKEAAQAIKQSGFNLDYLAQGADKMPGSGGPSWLGKGVYLAEDPHTAQTFAHITGGADGAVVKGLVDDEKLLDMADQKVWDAFLAEKGWPGEYKQYFSNAMLHKLFSKDINEYAEKQGKVGVRYPNETVVFDPTAIQVEKGATP